MAIVTLSDTMLQRLTIKDGRLLRDRALCGLCIRMGKRNRSFQIATSCNGKQVRVTVGRWPLISVEEARALAMPILQGCRSGNPPAKAKRLTLPTLRESVAAYATAKGIKASSLKRYNSILATHFTDWFDLPVTALGTPAFRESCHQFAQTRGAALVEVGRGLIGALMKYLNAVHSLELRSPFARLADAGLMPDRAQPRQRKLQEYDLPKWRTAVDSLPELQRDYLMLLLMTGLRRNEGTGIRSEHIDLDRNVLLIPDTKNGRSHTLPITDPMKEILERRINGTSPGGLIFSSVSAEHVAEMASRIGAPKFMLHDLRKLLATTGEKLAVGDAVLRRILNHTAKRSDVLHRHYISIEVDDIRQPLSAIQEALEKMTRNGNAEPPSASATSPAKTGSLEIDTGNTNG